MRDVVERDRDLVLVGIGAARVRGGGVGHRAGVEIGLGQRGGRGAGDRLAGIEEGVLVADRRKRRAALISRAVVADGDRPLQAYVAGVLHGERVLDDVAGVDAVI